MFPSGIRNEPLGRRSTAPPHACRSPADALAADLVSIGAAAITCYTRADLTLIPLGHWHVPLLALATGLGCAAHIAGDELTHGGCPIFWPFSMHEFHLVPRPLQITTAKVGENWIIFPLLTGALVLAVWHATGHPL